MPLERQDQPLIRRDAAVEGVEIAALNGRRPMASLTFTH